MYCGPLVGGLLLFSGKGEANISYPYMLMGVVVLAVGFIFSRIKLPEIVHVDDLADGETVKRSLWSHKLFLFGIVALFSYEIAEISINSFFINYVVDDGWMNARDAAVVLSFGGLGLFMCGRFAGSWIMQRIRAERVLLCCALGTVMATFLIVCNLGKISLIALFLVYVFEAIMFPTIFAISLKGLGGKTKRASSFLMMSPVGGAVGPVLMGYVADNSTMSLSFSYHLFLFVLCYSIRGMLTWKETEMNNPIQLLGFIGIVHFFLNFSAFKELVRMIFHTSSSVLLKGPDASSSVSCIAAAKQPASL